MKNIKVLGSGCRNCELTAKLIADEASKNNIAVKIEKVTDMAKIMSYGIMSTPGVVIDEKVVHAGGIPTATNIATWLS
ncbi:glutaredoxin [Achromatium sp. WMS3]|nr:glutaredoxin [Achromatium sp. WMS3]